MVLKDMGRRKALGLLAATCAFAAVPAVAAAQQFPDQSHFQKVTLNDRPGEPISLAVLPDLRVLHTARTGQVRLHDPRTGLNPVIACAVVGVALAAPRCAGSAGWCRCSWCGRTSTAG